VNEKTPIQQKQTFIFAGYYLIVPHVVKLIDKVRDLQANSYNKSHSHFEQPGSQKSFDVIHKSNHMKDYKHLQFKYTVINEIKSAVIEFSSLLSSICEVQRGVEWLDNLFQ
jgi:hypothetical protein